MVDTFPHNLHARVASLVDDFSRHRSAFAEHAARNAALLLTMAQLCQALRDAAAQSRVVRRLARGNQRRTSPAKQASRPQACALPAARLRKVMTFINASLDQRLDVPSLAAVAGMSPGYFTAMFKRATGLTPHEAVTQRRLARSQELLADESLTVAAIGYQLGFSSHAHFCTAFRRRVGLSPTAWRAQQRRRAINHRGNSSFSMNTKSSSQDFESHTGPDAA